MAKTSSLTKTVFLNAPCELVWEFLTNKDKLGTWYHPAKTGLSADQAYELLRSSDDGSQKTIVTGRVLEWAPPHRLATTFHIGPFGDNETTITWDLAEVAGGTMVTLVHDGIAEAAGDSAAGLLAALDKGWDVHLDKLRDNAC